MSPRERQAFVLRHTRLTPTAEVPSISLHVGAEATALWMKTEEDLGALGLPPPFWAFAWAGGQALARHVLDNPLLVKGRRVYDVASGSGLVAIAAALAGAADVRANDIDDFALSAIALNARANHAVVRIEAGDQVGRRIDAEVVLAGDIFYERDMAARLADWLCALARAGALVLVGDPGRTYFPRERLEWIIDYDIPVDRALEDVDFKRSSIWRIPG